MEEEKENQEKPKFQYEIRTLTEDLYFAGFPKFSSDYQYLIYFSVKDEFHTHTTSYSLDVVKNYGKDGEETSYTAVKREYELNDEFSGIFGYHHTFDQAKFIEGIMAISYF